MVAELGAWWWGSGAALQGRQAAGQGSAEAIGGLPTRPCTAPRATPQVLACIGEQFTDGDEICGVAVNVRAKGDRIELWTRTAANEAKQARAACVRPAWRRCMPASLCCPLTPPPLPTHAQTIAGRELKKFLDISDTTKIGYQVFQEVLNSKGKAKDRYGV